MFSKEKRSIVVSLGDDGAIVGCYNGNKLLKRLFVTSHLSSDFVDVVKQYSDATIYLLLDTIDQNYIFSSIPNVGSSGVKKIVKRKAENELDKNDLNSYIFLGKDKSSAKNALRYLFISVRNSNPFKDWIDALSDVPNKFGGVYLVPIEAEEFISKLRKVTHPDRKDTIDEWEVFVSFNRVGGFRQVVLKDGKLIFTRISQSISLQTPDAVGRSISQESANTLEYIRRIGFYDQNISIYIISSKESSNFIEIPGIKERDIYHYSPFELSQKLGIEQSAQESDKFGDVLFATNFIGNNKKTLRLSTPQIKKAESMQSAFTILTIFSWLLIVSFLLGSVYLLYDGYSKIGEIEQADNRVNRLSAELQTQQDFQKEYGVNPESLKDAVAYRQMFNETDSKLFEILQKYKNADIYSKYVENISIKMDDTAKKTVEIKVVFDLSEEKNYSDILYKFDKYVNTIKEAFGETYSVTFSGLPNENDIKVDLEKVADAKDSIKNITVSISEVGSEIRPY